MFTTNDIQEALGIIWAENEKKNNTIEIIKDIFSKEFVENISDTGGHKHHYGVSNEIKKDIYGYLIDNNFITEKNGRVEFTAVGEKQAQHITRLQRLAERLLHDVLEIYGKELDQSACEFEHILTPEVEESICTLLGHPRLCPHGLPIPEGKCCKKSITEARPIITTVEKLDVGESANISYLYTQDHAILHKLLAMGLSPGVEIKLHQKSPALIIILDNSTIALENSVGKCIFVRRK